MDCFQLPGDWSPADGEAPASTVRFLPLTAPAIILFLAACSSAPVASNGKGPGSAPAKKLNSSPFRLTKGMRVEELILALGEPKEKRVIETASGNGEIWIYQQTRDEYLRVSLGTDSSMGQTHEARTSQGVNIPMNTGGASQSVGWMETRRSTKETTLILVIDKMVAGWDRTRKEDRSLH